MIYDYLNFIFFLDANGVYFGAAELRTRGPALLQRDGGGRRRGCGPQRRVISRGPRELDAADLLPPGDAATLTNIRHPLVVDPVANSISLVPDVACS